MVKVREIVEEAAQAAQRPAAILPSVVKQQTRIGQFTAQIAANQQAQTPATNDEMAIAVWRAAELQRQTDKNYARRLRQQATQAMQANAPKAPKVGGRYKR